MKAANFIARFIKVERDEGKGIEKYLFDILVEGSTFTSYSCSLNKGGELISFSKDFKNLVEDFPNLKPKILDRCRQQLEQLKDVI